MISPEVKAVVVLASRRLIRLIKVRGEDPTLINCAINIFRGRGEMTKGPDLSNDVLNVSAVIPSIIRPNVLLQSKKCDNFIDVFVEENH